MIEFIRKRIQKEGLQAILWITLFSFVGGIFVMYKRNPKSTMSIGSVNGYEIDRNEFIRKVNQEYRLYNRIQEQLGPQAQEFLKMQGRPEERVLQELINDKVVESAIDKVGTKIGSEFIEKKISDPAFVMDSLSSYIPQEALYAPGGLNIAAITYFLQRQGVTDADFNDAVETALKKQFFHELVAGAFYIPTTELKKLYQELYAKKKYAFLGLALDEYQKKAKEKETTVALPELTQFYQRQSRNYVVPEKRSATVWQFNPNDYGISVTDKEIQEYYARNKRLFIEHPETMTIKRILFVMKPEATMTELAGVQQEAHKVYEQVTKNPASFDELAQKSPSIEVKRGDKDFNYELAVFGLEKNGDISKVIQTSEGFEIVKRLGKKEVVFKDSAKVTDEIRKKLMLEKFKRLFDIDAQRIIVQSYDNPEVVKKFVTDKKGIETKTGRVAKQGSLKSQKIFALKEKGKAFFQEGDAGYIVQLDAVEKSFLPELATIKDKVTADYYKDKALGMMEADAKKIKEKLESGSSLDAVAKEFQAKVTPVDWVNPTAQGAWDSFQKQSIPTQRIAKLVTPKASVIEVTPTHAFVIQLTQVDPLNEAEFAKKRGELMYQVYQRELGKFDFAFIQALKQAADVTIAPQAMQGVRMQ